jgi:hypothetical protein
MRTMVAAAVLVMALEARAGPSLTPEQQVVAEAVDAAEAAVNESAFAGKTEGFVRMWLDRATQEGLGA